MKAHFEITGAVIRIGPDMVEPPDNFEVAVLVSSIDGKTAFLKGAAMKDQGGKMDIRHVRAAKAIAKANGFKRVKWERARHMRKETADD